MEREYVDDSSSTDEPPRPDSAEGRELVDDAGTGEQEVGMSPVMPEDRVMDANPTALGE